MLEIRMAKLESRINDEFPNDQRAKQAHRPKSLLSSFRHSSFVLRVSTPGRAWQHVSHLDRTPQARNNQKISQCLSEPVRSGDRGDDRRLRRLRCCGRDVRFRDVHPEHRSHWTSRRGEINLCGTRKAQMQRVHMTMPGTPPVDQNRDRQQKRQD